MLLTPFTPAEIASSPDDFFGRYDELRTLERSLMQGSVIIEGGIGIGKSSLLSRLILLMEGFDSYHKAHCVISVGDKDLDSIDAAARLILESFTQVDEKRGYVYDTTIHLLEIYDRFDDLKKILKIANKTFPTKINRERAMHLISKESIHWFVENNIIAVESADEYKLMDEFLRIRLFLDDEKVDPESFEQKLLESETSNVTDEMVFSYFIEDFKSDNPYEDEEDIDFDENDEKENPDPKE